jgi:endonuclease YncB( thermonuclease family)
MTSVVTILATFAILSCFSAVADAATLQAKVVEVKTGNTLIVSNTNRSVKVRLKSVAPPEAGQPFAELARDHLKALVLDQTVTVDYTHLADGYFESRVLLNGIDIGSQMLRDGVAWYDHATDYELNESDRDLYAKCEQAARSEKRGLWQDASPLAPWEYRHLQQAKAESPQNQTYEPSSPKAQKAEKSVSNQDYLMAKSANRNSKPSLRKIAEYGSFDRWIAYDSSLGRFSVQIPSNAIESFGMSVDENGLLVEYDILTADSDYKIKPAFFAVVSGKVPNQNRTDASILDQSIESLIAGMNESAKKTAISGLASVKRVRELKLGEYAGRQYSVAGGVFSGTARVFTKRFGEERRVLLVLALTRYGTESLGDQFLDSFRILQ